MENKLIASNFNHFVLSTLCRYKAKSKLLKDLIKFSETIDSNKIVIEWENYLGDAVLADNLKVIKMILESKVVIYNYKNHLGQTVEEGLLARAILCKRWRIFKYFITGALTGASTWNLTNLLWSSIFGSTIIECSFMEEKELVNDSAPKYILDMVQTHPALIDSYYEWVSKHDTTKPTRLRFY